MAAGSSLPSSHPHGRFCQDRALGHSGLRPPSLAALSASSSQGCGRKEPQAQGRGSAGHPGRGAWCSGAALPFWGPSADCTLPRATSSMRPLLLSIFSTEAGLARPGKMGWQLEGSESLAPEGLLGMGRKGARQLSAPPPFMRKSQLTIPLPVPQ